MGSVNERGDVPVVLNTGEFSLAVVARDQPALTIAGLAIGKAGWFPEHTHPVLLVPAQGAVVGNVVKEQALVIAKPHWPLQPAEALGQQLQLGVEQHQLVKAWVVALGAGGGVGARHR